MTSFWLTWLRVSALLLVGYGLIMTLGVLAVFEPVIRTMIDLVLWPQNVADGALSLRARFITGVGGGLLLGWGTMIYFAVTKVLAHGEERVRTGLIAGLCAWFVADGAASYALGAYANIAANTGFAALFLLPLFAGRVKTVQTELTGPAKLKT